MLGQYLGAFLGSAVLYGVYYDAISYVGFILTYIWYK